GGGGGGAGRLVVGKVPWVFCTPRAGTPPSPPPFSSPRHYSHPETSRPMPDSLPRSAGRGPCRDRAEAPIIAPTLSLTRDSATVDSSGRRHTMEHPRPDDKDWTWVLDRPCPACHFDAGTVARPLIRATVRTTL